jgi:hypothetical protein
MGVLNNFLTMGCPQTSILPISTSKIARVAGMNHTWPNWKEISACLSCA